MSSTNPESERQTSADKVFTRLHEEIMSLKLMPGAKISEADIAERFNVSRQPVRDAFNRLAWLDLVLIRPQRATVVRGFSEQKIAESRFVRLAIEMEVIREACQKWDDVCTEKSMQILREQMAAAHDGQQARFNALDLEFHTQLCLFAGVPCVVNYIKSCRQQTDRLCNLSTDFDCEKDAVIEEHRQVIVALDKRNYAKASDILRDHLCRLDLVIDEIRASHTNYFY